MERRLIFFVSGSILLACAFLTSGVTGALYWVGMTDWANYPKSSTIFFGFFSELSQEPSRQGAMPSYEVRGKPAQAPSVSLGVAF